MSPLKLLIGIVVILMVLIVYVIGFQPKYLPQALAEYHQPVRTHVDKGTNWLNQIVGNIKSSQIKPFGEVVQTSEIVSVDTQTEKTLPQKALEYGRYQYCLQVVKEYEATKNGNVSTPVPSPSPSEQ